MALRESTTRLDGVWLRALLLAIIAVSGAVAIVTVAVNASASSTIASEAQRSLDIANMQSAVQVESEEAADFVGRDMGMEGGDHAAADSTSDDHPGVSAIHSDAAPAEVADLADHPEMVAAIESFRVSAAHLSQDVDPDTQASLRQAVANHTAYIATVKSLNETAHAGGDAMSIYHTDTQLIEADLRNSLNDLRDRVGAALSEAIERAQRSQRLLDFALPIAAAAGLVAAIGMVRSRAAMREVTTLEEVVAAKDRFIGTVSHELRTPLSAIVGFADVLRSEDADLEESDRREYATLILNQGNEVSAIVEDLLVAARAEIGDLSTVDKPIDLVAQTHQVVEALPPPLDQLEVAGPRLLARGDPGRVRQIIRNLLTNAHRYGGPNVRVEFEQVGDVAVVRVIDDGDPIPVDQREHIFEPYRTVKDARPVTGSVGLGLAVSRQLARLMGGDIIYSHRAGQSVFELSLGCDRATEAELAPPRAETMSSRAANI